MMPNNSRARLDANKRYIQKAYDKPTIRFKKSDCDALKAHCKAKGQSFNDFIVSAALDRMAQEKKQGIGIDTVTQEPTDKAE